MGLTLCTVYRRVGSVGMVVGLASVIAAFVHHWSSLPSKYTWWFTVDMLVETIHEPLLPTLAVFAWVVGRSSRSTEDTTSNLRIQALSVLAGALVTVGAARAFPAMFASDQAALGAGVTMMLASSTHLAPEAIVRRLAEAAVVLALCVMAGYAHTIAKALILQHGIHDAAVIAAERILFGGSPHRALTRWSEGHPRVIAAASYIYRWSNAEFLVVSTLLVAAGRRRERIEFLSALCFALILAAPLYYVAPSEGPYFSEPWLYQHLSQQLLVTDWYVWLSRHSQDVQLGLGTEVTTFTYLAAMPSLHVGFAAIAAWYCRFSPIALALATGYFLFSWFATMILGWHYFSDGLAGIAIAAVCVIGARRSRWLLPGWLS